MTDLARRPLRRDDADAPDSPAADPGRVERATGDPAADAAWAQRRAAARARRGAARRRRRARWMTGLTALAALVAVVPLVSILSFLVVRGAGALSPALLLRSTTPGSEPGLANALAGSLVLLAIAGGLGIPVGVGAGLFLVEWRGTRAAGVVRYLADVLLGVPSIVFGIVAWQLLVRPVGHFSAWAGGAALGAMIVPLVARTTGDVLALVPAGFAEAALALGYPRWRTALTVVLRAALPGVVTGVLLAVARVAGETAPLLFTAFGNQFWSVRPDRPIAALPLQIYTAALGASPGARAAAYAGALVLVAAIALFSWAARRATAVRGDRRRRAHRVGAA